MSKLKAVVYTSCFFSGFVVHEDMFNKREVRNANIKESRNKKNQTRKS